MPTMDLARKMIGDTLRMPEIAAQVGDPQQVMLNALAMQAGAGKTGPAQNGVGQTPQAPGMLPEQAAGGEVQGP
jgi:hypothetical protein